MAHVGVIQVLEEHGIHIAAIAGSSMGAYVGSLWAAGFDGVKLEALAREIGDRRTLLRLLDPVFPPTAGLIRGHKLRRHLERSLVAKTFAELRTPMIVVATDLETRAPHVFSEGRVAPAVHASAAIPGICAPVMLEGRRFTDGGTAQPLPVTLLRKHFQVDHIIAVNLVPTVAEMAAKRSPPAKAHFKSFRWLWNKINLMAEGNVIDTFQRALLSAQMHIAAAECAHADVVLHPRCATAAWNDFEHFAQHIAAGRDAALAALPQIMALINATGSSTQTTTDNSPSKGGGYYETAKSHTTLGLVRA